MQIISDVYNDAATPSKKPGGYEWWYFDAIDNSSGYSIVVILYQGNPFSNRYIRQLQKEPQGKKSLPDEFPAISISVYKGSKPVYYSFTEYPSAHSHFGIQKPEIQLGKHTLTSHHNEDKFTYTLKLREELASGDRIEATLRFESSKPGVSEFKGKEDGEPAGHLWNLVQPVVKVTGYIQLNDASNGNREVDFSGRGYHDHNMGQEPMKDEFKDWYWGRFHFGNETLIYYVMNRQQKQQYRGWLIDNKSLEITAQFEEFDLQDHNLTVFGLQPARKLIMNTGKVRAVVQQHHSLDTGPFYQRFLSEAFLSRDMEDIHKSTGFSEYIYPERIYWRVLWPLVDMRIRYRKEKPHWVQKSPRLYRWTW